MCSLICKPLMLHTHTHTHLRTSGKNDTVIGDVKKKIEKKIKEKEIDKEEKEKKEKQKKCGEGKGRTRGKTHVVHT